MALITKSTLECDFRKRETGFDIITKSDLIFFLTKQKGDKGN